MAQLLGEVMDERPMPDGSSATIRKLGNQWSLKFGIVSRMLSLGNLADAKILSVSQVGDSVNVLLSTLSPSCQQTDMLVNLRKNTTKVNKWDIASTHCNSSEQPSLYVKTGKNEEYIDVVRGDSVKRMTRFIYRGGELYRTREVILPKEQVAQPARTTKKKEQVTRSGLPVTPTATATPTSGTVSSATGALQPAADMVIPARLDFGTPVRQEKVTVDLM
jgi:hypothetical protein